jgi:hypothetical protein
MRTPPAAVIDQLLDQVHLGLASQVRRFGQNGEAVGAVAYGALGRFDLTGFRISSPCGLGSCEGQDGGEKNGFHGKTIKRKTKKAGRA